MGEIPLNYEPKKALRVQGDEFTIVVVGIRICGSTIIIDALLLLNFDD